MPRLHCPLCTYSALPTLSLYVAHIRLNHADDPGFRISCTLQGCSRSFTNFCTYRNHLYAYHDLRAEENSSPVVEHDSSNEPLDDMELEESNDATGTPTIESIVSEDALQRAAALMILKAREQHRIPLAVMDGVLGDFQSLYQVAMTACRTKIENSLVEAGVGDDAIASALIHLKEGAPFTNIFRGLQTQHQQLAYFRKNFGLVVSTNNRFLRLKGLAMGVL